MSEWIPLRLRRWLGDDLNAVVSSHIRSLVAAQLPEDRDIEYKSEIDPTPEKGSTSLAKAVAAFANTSGGILLVGVAETDGTLGICASRDNPQQFADRLHQVVAARVHPLPDFECRAVEIPDGWVHLVAVLPSVKKPHTLSVKGESFRYPSRHGGTTRHLTSPEVADMYHRRYAATAAAAQSIRDVHSDAAAWWHDERRREVVALVVGCVPHVRGYQQLTADYAEDRLNWALPQLRALPPLDKFTRWVPSVRFRAVELSGAYAVGADHPTERITLFLDGSGRSIHVCQDNPLCPSPDSPAVRIVDIVASLLTHIPLLARHAAGTGAVGDIEFGVQLLTGKPTCLASMEWDRYEGRRVWATVATPTQLATRSIPLRSATMPSPDLLSLVGALGSDIVSSFGQATVPQITPSNELDQQEFPADWGEKVQAWATAPT